MLSAAKDTLLFRLLSSIDSADNLRQRAHDILVARSKLPPSQRPPIAPPRIRPEEGHGIRRLRLSAGRAA